MTKGGGITDRAKQNAAYAAIAIKALGNGDDPAFSFLVDRKASDEGRPRAVRLTILAALGRLNTEAAIRRVAAAICKRRPRPNTKTALRTIRTLVKLAKRPEWVEWAEKHR